MPRPSATFLVLCLALSSGSWANDHSDNPHQGTWLSSPSSVAGSIDHDSDRDWFRINVQSGVRYSFETTQLSSNMDSVIALFAPSGQRVGLDDDGGQGLASRLEWTATSSGQAWFVVLHYSSSGRGSYTLLSDDDSTPSAPITTAPSGIPAGTTASSGSITAARIFDPKLPGARLDISVQHSQAAGGRLAILNPQDQQVASFNLSSNSAQVSWDGTSGGSYVPPGGYRAVLLKNGQQLDQLQVALVRLGAREIRWQGSGRVPLMYHRADPAWLRSYLPLDAIGASWSVSRSDGSLDSSAGQPLPVPVMWNDPATPPRLSSGAATNRGFSLPVAYAAGTTRRAQLTLGDASVSAQGATLGCGYPVSGLPLRVVFGGFASGPIQPGSQVAVDLNPLGTGVARLDYDLVLRFEYQDGSGWYEVPGAINVAQRFYVLLRAPQLAPAGFSNGQAPYLPWVQAVDQVAQWSAGNAYDDEALMDVVTDGVFRSLGLRYENSAGAPAYSAGSPWQSTMDLAAFDTRYYGSLVNCTDCANLVSVYARMVGVDAQNLYLGYNFSLHWIKGIGRSWTHDVFNSGGHGFSFHNIATWTQGSTVHDACLALDGDANPGSAPHQELLPQGLSFYTYRSRLSPGSFQGLALDRSRIE